MSMLQMYQGRIESGRFVPVNPVALPDIPEAYLVVESRILEQSKTLAQRQNEALNQFRAGVKKITDEPIDDEFRAIVNSGIIVDSGVNL